MTQRDPKEVLRDTAAIYAAATLAAAAVHEPPAARPLPQVVMVEDAEPGRAPDRYDEEFFAGDDIEARAAASAEERLKLTRAKPAPVIVDHLPLHLELGRNEAGMIFSADGAVHVLPLDNQEDCAAVNARIAALCHPGFKQRHYGC